MGIRTLLCVLLRTSVLSQPNFLWQSPLVSQGPTPNREPKKNLAQHSHRANQTKIAQNRSQLRQSLSVPISVSLWFSLSPPLPLCLPPLSPSLCLLLSPSLLSLSPSLSICLPPYLSPPSPTLFLFPCLPCFPLCLSFSVSVCVSLCPLTPYSSYAEFPAQ